MPFEPATRTVPREPTDFASTVAPLVAADGASDAAADGAVDGASDGAEDAAADGLAATDAAGEAVAAGLLQATIAREATRTARAVRTVERMGFDLARTCMGTCRQLLADITSYVHPTRAGFACHASRPPTAIQAVLSTRGRLGRVVSC
jgi:hypothetical protein